jgi:hypothetical protein
VRRRRLLNGHLVQRLRLGLLEVLPGGDEEGLVGVVADRDAPAGGDMPKDGVFLLVEVDTDGFQGHGVLPGWGFGTVEGD